VDDEHLTAMREATALTRAGRLAEATALIQQSLGGNRPVRVVPGEIVMDEERLSGGDRPVQVVPGEIVVDEERLSGDSPPAASPLTEPRPADGLRGRLREGLSRAATGVRTRLTPSGPAAADTAPALPGETLHRVHHGATGARSYILYVPTTGTGPRPLVLMLHGGTQTAADFAAATRMSELAEEHGFLVAYPEQDTSANAMRYWNWFEPDDQRRGAGEPAILVGIVAEVAAQYEVDRERVYVAGFSAGAAMAAVLGAAYPDVFAAVGVHSGLPQGCATDVGSAFAAMRSARPGRPLARPVPVIAFHGDADPTVAVENAARVVEQFTGGPLRGDTLVERGPGRPATRLVVRRAGEPVGELWTVHGSAHAWSGGAAGGSYTDPAGPDASAEMVRFFAEHPRRG
jgi:poly(hydroxyalkanoate) depolymerase family esterase